MLRDYIAERRQQHDILLMTHIVLGYPTFDDSLRMVEAMVEAGVDLMELQIPFSEPIADGPVILRANAEALAAGSTVDRCLDFGAEGPQTLDMQINRSRSDRTTARQRYIGRTKAGDQRTEHEYRCTHGFHQVIGCRKILDIVRIDDHIHRIMDDHINTRGCSFER